MYHSTTVLFEIESTAKLLELITNTAFNSKEIGNLIIIKKFFTLMFHNNMEEFKTMKMIYGNELSNLLAQYLK